MFGREPGWPEKAPTARATSRENEFAYEVENARRSIQPSTMSGLAWAGSGVEGGGPDELAEAFLLQDVCGPAGGARTGEHGRHHGCGDPGEVEDDCGPELNVGLDDPVRASFA